MSLVPNTVYANPSSALFSPIGSGGGGGGGVGPDLVVSSIVINEKSNQNGGALAFSYDFPFSSAVVPAGMVGLQQGVVKDNLGNATNAVMAATNNAGAGQTTDFAATRVIVGSQGTGANALAKPTIYEAAGYCMIDPSISTPELIVSSINGAAPALTTGSVVDVKQILDALFAANPSLVPVSY